MMEDMAINTQPETEGVGEALNGLARPVHGREFKRTTDVTDKNGPINVVLLAPEGAPDNWVQGAADLLVLPCPESCSTERWEALQEDSYCFLRDWAPQAHELGWTALDLFGVHPVKPWERFDCMGLVPLLNGAAVVALSDIEATIEKPNGARLTYHRRGVAHDEACLVWGLK